MPTFNLDVQTLVIFCALFAGLIFIVFILRPLLKKYIENPKSEKTLAAIIIVVFVFILACFWFYAEREVKDIDPIDEPSAQPDFWKKVDGKEHKTMTKEKLEQIRKQEQAKKEEKEKKKEEKQQEEMAKDREDFFKEVTKPRGN